MTAAHTLAVVETALSTEGSPADDLWLYEGLSLSL